MYATIPTFSYIEVYLTMFGWNMYELLFELADDLNLLLIPFLVIIVRNFIVPLSTENVFPNSGGSVSQMRVDLPVALVVFVFMVVPYVKIEPNSIEYTPVCQLGDASYTYGDTNTTYDTTQLARFHEEHPRIPMFWAVVLSISGGMTQAVLRNLPCFQDYSGLAFRTRHAFIKDPGIRQEFDHFASQCFVPAWRKYEIFKPPEEVVERKDAEYPGNRYFLEQPGYYALCDEVTEQGACSFDPYPRPRTEVKRWQGAHRLPACRDWWLGDGENEGLLKILVRFVPDMDWIADFTKGTYSRDVIEEEMVRNTILNGPRRYGIGGPDNEILAGLAAFAAGSGLASGLAAWAASGSLAAFTLSTAVGATAFVGSEALGLYARLHIMRRIAPMAQSLMLMVLYMLLGAYLFLTFYSLTAAMRIMTMMVAVRLFSMMFGISNFLDDALIDAMYPGMKLGDAGRWEVDRVALGYGTMALHMLLPLGLLWVVYAAGNAAMRGMDALGPSSDPTGIGNSARVSTLGMARNMKR